MAALLIAALAYWSPILADPGGRVAGGNGEPLLIAYILTWVAEHLADAELWNPPFFYPATGVLAYSDHLIGLGTLAWPLVKADLPPGVIVNVLSIAASLSTSFAVYVWLRDRGSAPVPAAAAAIIVVYSAWRHLQVAHLQVQFTAFLPLALLCYSRAIEAPGQGRWAWLGSAALALQTLFTPSLGVYLAPLTIVWLIVASLLVRRGTWRHWTLLATSLTVVPLVNLAIAPHYWALGEMLHRSTVEVARHSATWMDWISAPPHWLYGEALAFTRGRERELFAGIGFAVVTLVGVVTVVRASDRLAIAGLVTAALAIWAATGVTVSSQSAAHLPYELFFRLMPGGAQVRVPVRFVLPAAIFLAPAIASGWSTILAAIAARQPGVTASIVTLLLAGVVSAEALPERARFDAALPLSSHAVPVEAGRDAIVMLPLAAPYGPHGEIARMWSARLAGVPIVNGYSGHESSLYRHLRYLLDTTPDAEGQSALYALLRDNGVSTIVAAQASAWVDSSRLRQTAPGVFHIPDEARMLHVSRLEMGRGAGLVVTESGWSYPERNERESWIWSTSQRATLRVPLGSEPRRTIALRARSQSDAGEELELWWRGRRLGVRPLSKGPAFHEFRLPAAANGAGWIDLELRGPRPIRVLGNSDIRALSVCLFEIRLE